MYLFILCIIIIHFICMLKKTTTKKKKTRTNKIMFMLSICHNHLNVVCFFTYFNPCFFQLGVKAVVFFYSDSCKTEQNIYKILVWNTN